MVTSARTFNSAMCWLSPATAISRFEREAIGRDGERYAWSFIVVSEVHGGRVARVGQFDVDDEEAAFTYAEERARAAAGRLAVANGASQASDALGRATDAADCDGVVACYADAFVFDDRRRLSGDPVRDAADLRRGIERILAQYSHFEYRKLAVRGDRLALLWSRWLDDSGNETAYLHVREIDDDGRFTYDGRFDEDDFEGAYRELERRYYAAEGAAFAEAGLDARPTMRSPHQSGRPRQVVRRTHRPRASASRTVHAQAFPTARAEISRQLCTSWTRWSPRCGHGPRPICWLSPTWSVARQEREAVGQDGEHYAWTRLVVSEVRDGRIASIASSSSTTRRRRSPTPRNGCGATASRLAVTNRASADVWTPVGRAMRAHDARRRRRSTSRSFVYDDRRRCDAESRR